jgi:SOS response regulatory protein OraA/RecX
MDAHTAALRLLARRELSTAQLRARLARKFEAAEIDEAIERLSKDRTLDDRRVAVAAARMEGVVRRRGRRRVIQRVQQLGISADVAKAAVDEVFGDIDERTLLDEAIDKKLKGVDPRQLDAGAAASLVRSLVGQGFDADQVYSRLRARGTRSSFRAE